MSALTYEELAIGVAVLLVLGNGISMLRRFVSWLQWRDFERHASQQEMEALSGRSIAGPTTAEFLADWREAQGRASVRTLVSSLVEEIRGLDRTWLPALTAVAMQCLAFFGRWPHTFYVILRIVVTLSAAYLALRAHSLRSTFWAWTMVSMGTVFNPIITFQLNRANWQIFDLCGAALFAFAASSLSRRAGR